MLYLTKRRITIIILLTFFLFSCLFVKLGYITFVSANTINNYAFDLWSREVPISSRRGLVYDRNGKVIIDNEICYTVYSINRQIENLNETATILATNLGCSTEDIIKHLKKNNSIEILNPEGRKIDEKIAYIISSYNLKGIYITCDIKRNYPYNTSLGQVLGFCGIDGYGLSGIEYQYNEYLENQKGSLKIYTDAKGNLLHDMETEYVESTPGLNITLTVDISLQLILDNVINEAISLYTPDKIMGLMLNAKTGEVLAMSSYPYFNPNNYKDYSEEIYNRNLPIFNQFELGSTFKIITYSAALEENLFDFNDIIHCSGSRTIGGRRIKCWKTHGTQTYLEGIQNSCNVCFMELGERLGKEKFYEYLEKFGMTRKTGIDLAGEGSSIIVSKDNCGPVELATESFGHANAFTPIQLSTAAIASVNGGILLTPYTLKSISTYYGDLLFENTTKTRNTVVSKKTSDYMKYALENVCALGTGRNAFVEGYRIGGKTGTAQVISSTGGYEAGHYILSFCGIAPMNDPEIVCYLALDRCKNTVQYGGVVAAPLVGKIMEQSLSYLGIDRDYENQIEKNLRWFLDTPTYKVDNYVGKSIKDIKNNYFYKFVYYGEGDTVIYQSPNAGEKIKEGDTIMLYLE